MSNAACHLVDVHTFIQWEKGTQLSADVRLDLLKDAEHIKGEIFQTLNHINSKLKER